ncbi:MAG: tRNA threonylcarbamoyladenosine biosynthesis protein [Parcubacteria group bacterium Greene0714_21]|nr:MAG: tRNA threonylcarbamoyladenosine biosynthesis protein [Parcubacteria group bacterium Greene0416_39]TSC98053.1 MAG: tRNA threonylcarbamoyladenosine biosynthesis protein [Parcubacteria group bacterium Greene1014_47]TSD04157.1 MAG: tRNA threonylcarbamoyladenosine biosynthesis protein [Parcubacteria group bacterium Greene0714_21]
MIVWKINPKNFGAIAKKAVLALQKGKVLACPTDTVYGLIADAANKKAVQKIFQIKGRDIGKPLPVFVKDVAMAKRIARVSPLQEKYMREVWPGKVTLILESRGLLAKGTGTQESIGLRIPKHKLVQAILQKVNKPVTGTSANLSGEPPLSDSKEIFRKFQNKKSQPDILIDAGKLSFSKPSKVIDIRGKKPITIRK